MKSFGLCRKPIWNVIGWLGQHGSPGPGALNPENQAAVSRVTMRQRPDPRVGAPAGNRTRWSGLVRVGQASIPRTPPKNGPGVSALVVGVLEAVRAGQTSCEGAFGPLLRVCIEVGTS
jgi:hypothetical protein